MLPAVLTTFWIIIAARLCSASAGSLPADFKWSIALKEVKLGEQTAITYQVDTTVPDFHITFHVDSIVIEEMHVTETPVFGMTVHKMEKTGRHNVSVRLTWGDQTANFFDYVWVYRPIAKAHVLFAVTSSVVVPPGNISALITITDSSELPTMIVGFISWGDEQMTALNLTQGTLPGSSGAASWTEEHTYPESENFTVTLTLRNPVSLVKLNRTVITIEKLSLYNVTIKDHEGSLAPSTLTSGLPLVFELFAESGIARMYILKVGEEVVRSLQRQIPYEFRKPGRYKVTAEISGPAGVSEPFVVEVDVEAALRTRDITLDTPSLVVFPPGNATTYLEITSGSHLPTNVQGSISWGDKGPLTYIDLRNDTGPEATGSLRKPLVHTFAGAGSYEVTLYAYNNVSTVNIAKSLNVLASLALGGIHVDYENPSDSPRWDTPVFKAHVPLNLTAMVQTGQVEEYKFQIGNKTMTSQTPSFAHTFLSAGDYTVTMQTSGDAGDSNVQSALVRIAQPLTTDNAVIEPPEYIVFPPGSLNVTLSLTAFMDEVATNVTGWLTWGDSPNDTEMVETDLVEGTGPGAAGPVSLVLEHQFSSTGQFVITWFLRNPVSEMNVTKIVTIQRQIELGPLLVLPLEEVPFVTEGFYLPGQTVNITPTSVVGRADRFVLSVPGMGDVVQDHEDFVTSFVAESDYEVTMRAEGSSGFSEPVSTFVRVRRKASGLKTEVSHTATRVMLEVTFTIEDPLLMGGCVSLDLGEGDGRLFGWRQASGCEGQAAGTEEWSQAPLTGRITLVHKYSSPGVYTPTARLFSFMGEETQVFKITVYESLPCSELRVWIPRNGTLDRPVNMTRADKLRVRSSSSVNCSASDLSMEIGEFLIGTALLIQFRPQVLSSVRKIQHRVSSITNSGAFFCQSLLRFLLNKNANRGFGFNINTVNVVFI